MHILSSLREASSSVREPRGCCLQTTAQMNSSFSGYDYMPSKGHGHRSFIMDDYITSGRQAKSRPDTTATADSCWELLRFRHEQPEFSPRPRQGKAETMFHSGFTRRQQPSIKQDEWRTKHEVSRQAIAMQATALRRKQLEGWQSFSYNGFNIITGEDFDPSKNKAHHTERRHVVENVASRYSLVGGDTNAGRLRDSTSRFFSTSEQLPHRPARAENISNDGLRVTTRTSTMIGLGPNRPQEIRSVGVREALSDSLYGLKRRGQLAANYDRAGPAR